MKSMDKAQEYTPPPPIGKYLITITLAEATFTKGDENNPKKKAGVTMLHMGGQIADGDYAGYKVWDWYWITDGDESGAGITKPNLRALGYPVDDPAFTKEDEEIARELLGTSVWANLKHETIKTKNEATGKYDQPRLVMHNGQLVKAQRLVLDSIVGPSSAPVTAAAPAAQPTAAPAAAATPAPKAAEAKADAPKPTTAQAPWLKTKPGAGAPAAK